MDQDLKVGEIAERSGVSVRTLHYYEEVGLLGPTRRTEAGHRLFGEREIERLQQIRSLVQLGFSLEEVKGVLGDPEFSPRRVLERHISFLDETLAVQRRLRDRLTRIRERMAAAEAVTIDEFLQAIKETTMFDQHFTPEQLAELAQRRRELGEDAIEKGQQDWSRLIAEVRDAMRRGLDPQSEAVLQLARRWQELVEAFTRRDPDLTRAVGAVWKHERPELERQHGDAAPSAEMMAYIGRAVRALPAAEE